MASRTFTGKLIRVATLVTTAAPVLDGYHFVDCTLRGPAVLHVAVGNRMLEGCVLDMGGGPVDASWWNVPAGSYRLGGIEFRNSTFERTVFTGCGFAGDPSDRDGWFGNLRFPPTAEPQ